MPRKWICARALALVFVVAAPAFAAAQAYVPAPCDVVTGGGNLVNDQGGRAGISAAVGCRDGALVGQVDYRDPDNGIRFQSTAITAWLTDLRRPWIRDACGIGRLAGVDEPVVFRARLVDNDEPGRLDQAGIVIEAYRLQTRELRNPGGGNLQRHRADGSVLPPIDADAMCGELLTP